MVRYFTPGSKRIYLPDVVLALIRSPNLPPTQACFRVPLTWNKFDIRDYLYHAYGVRALRVRSAVQAQPLTLRDNKPGRWKRPRSIKWMTVEMDKPFVFPEAPQDLSPWLAGGFGTDGFLKKVEKEMSEEMNKNGVPIVPQELTAAADKLLKGEIKWEPGWKVMGKSV